MRTLFQDFGGLLFKTRRTRRMADTGLADREAKAAKTQRRETRRQASGRRGRL